MKVDLKKEIASYTAPRGRFEIVEVPPLRYLMIDGHGAPAGPAFADAITTIYGVAYPLKFLSRRELDRDYVVPPLEALWWADDMTSFTVDRDTSQWSWTCLSLVPEWMPAELVDRAIATAAEKGAPSIGSVRLEDLIEGTCVQTLHVGSFDDEGPVLARMHDEFIPGQGLSMTGRHHEIYFSDFRRTDPAKLRTLLRQPVRR
ncbi:GyrI-like domain-containing protein [Microbacter sp. GSS18]|nr:GyrI-like domain-containing protein [Microbacter sp. GSS18]